MLDQKRIILVHTSHPGNIGATARAMKNMGLSQLYLVSPKSFPHPEALARASGADDVLAGAAVTNTLKEALTDCHYVYGTSGRNASLTWPVLGAREASQEIKESLAQSSERKIAIVFGQERTGLLNEELQQCQKQIFIPTNSDYASLNLAQAVQVITYECHMEMRETQACDKRYQQDGCLDDALATHQELENYYNHLEQVLIQTKFLDPSAPKQLMARLRRLFYRATPTQVEINILRGILTSVQKG